MSTVGANEQIIQKINTRGKKIQGKRSLYNQNIDILEAGSFQFFELERLGLLL